MNAIGIVFANLHQIDIPELTVDRAIGAVPFGCRHRLIDFSLSNMANSGITDIRVIAQNNYYSLMDHIGSGKDWDLARRSGGIKVLPQAYTGTGAHYRLESLKSFASIIKLLTADYVVMADCDCICNLDLRALVADHIANNADITMTVTRVNVNNMSKHPLTILESDESGNITDIANNSLNAEGEHDVAINVSVISTRYLQTIVDAAISHGYNSLTNDVMRKDIGTRIFRVFRYDGIYYPIYSLADYYNCNMALINDSSFHRSLFGVAQRPIMTKEHNTAPTRYLSSASVKNSMLADGCTIDGVVENSIIFRGVKVGHGAVIRNSILFQDTVIGENVEINCVITDKNVCIREGNRISGHSLRPYYVPKGMML